MNLTPTEEQLLVIEAVAGVLERELPFQRLYGGGPAADAGPLLAEAAESGWLKLGLPQDAGGVGYSVVEEALAHRELGRSVAPLSILATALAAHAALAAGDAALAGALMDGDRRAGFAVRLNGPQPDHLLLDAGDADLFVALGADVALFDVAGVAAEPAPCLDPTLQAARARLGPARLRIADPALRLRAQVLVAAQLCGLAERARDIAVGYAKTRVQFGHPIGAFQAIKHRCSDMATRCEAAYAQVCAAAAALNEGLPSAPLHAAAAWMAADEAAIENARAAVQVHGGIGVTDEHALHLLIKRRHVLAQLGAGEGLEAVLLEA